MVQTDQRRPITASVNIGPTACRRLRPRRLMRQPASLPSCHTPGRIGPGVDTPETTHQTLGVQPFGPEASALRYAPRRGKFQRDPVATNRSYVGTEFTKRIVKEPKDEIDERNRGSG